MARFESLTVKSAESQLSPFVRLFVQLLLEEGMQLANGSSGDNSAAVILCDSHLHHSSPGAAG